MGFKSGQLLSGDGMLPEFETQFECVACLCSDQWSVMTAGGRDYVWVFLVQSNCLNVSHLFQKGRNLFNFPVKSEYV